MIGIERSAINQVYTEAGREAVAALTQGLEVERHTDLGGHRVQFYQNEGFLVRCVAEHLAKSLRNGGSAVMLARKDHQGQILEVLAGMKISPEALVKHCIALDAGQALSQFMLNDAPDPSRFSTLLKELLHAARSSSQSALIPIAAFGEMVAVLWSEGKREAAVELEQLWNDFMRAQPLSLLCAYPIAYFSRTEDCSFFSQICNEHSSVLPAESFAALDEDLRAREIADLQQRAESLALEVETRKQAEAKLRAAQAELETLVEQRTTALRKLSLQVLKLQDLERRRIARELHDSLGQEFVGLQVNLNLAKRSPADPEHWKRCDLLLERCIEEVRTLSYLLHPPMIEDAGFLSAAQWYIEDFCHRSRMNISFSAQEDIGRLPEYLKLVLFRVLQEALMNIYRHAHATGGQVRVQRARNLVVLEVEDNGIGIRPEKLARFEHSGTGMGVGLTGMRERVRDLGGEFDLTSANGGTLVRISVPAYGKP